MATIPSTPLKPDCSSSKASHRLVDKPERLALRTTVVNEVGFSVFCFAVGGIGFYLFAVDASGPMAFFGWCWLIGMSFIGLIVLLLAAVRLKYGMKADFDLMSQELHVSGLRFPGGVVIPFSSILAIQVCSGRRVVPSSPDLGSPYSTYQLNIAWQDKENVSRLCLLNHGDLIRIRRQADRIATRLGVEMMDIAAETEECEPRKVRRRRRRAPSTSVQTDSEGRSR